MNWNRLPNGLYRCTRETLGGWAYEHALLDIGNKMGNPNVPRGLPIVYHMSKKGFQVEIMDFELWMVRVGEPISDRDCWMRLQKVQDNPGYDWRINSGEHFVNYLATGKKESTRIHMADLIVSCSLFFAV